MNPLTTKYLTLPNLFGAALFIYVALRIFIVPISDDEYITVDLHASQNWWGILTTAQPSIEWAPNNHILNTLFMKLEILLFGRQDWAVRLHILAAFVVCYYYIYQTLQLFTPSVVRQGLYLLVIFFNPYLLDFFGIARGYAMSIAAYSAAFYYLMLYSEQLSPKYLRNTFIALFLAVWSNFSALYLQLLISGLMVWVMYQHRRSIDYKRHFLYVAIANCAVLLIIFLPLLRTLASDQTFGGKTGVFQDCVVHYINQYIHFDRHINRHETWTSGWKLTEVLAVMFLLAWSLIHLISFLFPSRESLIKIQAYSLFLLAGVAALAKILFVWKGVPYPTARTVLLFSIPFYTGICATSERIIQHHRKAIFVLYLFLTLLCYHFFSAVTFENTLEWWQNGDAKRVLRYLKDDLKTAGNSEVLTFGVDGWFYHSIAFYTEKAFNGKMETKWSDLQSVEAFDYVYASFEHQNKVPASFEAVATFKHGVLYRSKNRGQAGVN